MILTVEGELLGVGAAVWVGLLVDLAAKGTLLLAAVALGSWLLGRATPAARSRLWTLAFGALMLIPVLAVIAGETGGGRRFGPALPAPLGGIVVLEGESGVRAGHRTAAASAVHGPGEGPRSVPDDVDDSAAGDPGPRWRRGIAPSWWRALALSWLAGLVLMAMRAGAGLVATLRLVREAHPVPPGPLRRQVEAEAARLGLRDRVTPRWCARTAVPFVTGLGPTLLVLPADVVTWPAARLRPVIMHELAHVRRRDVVRRLLGDLVALVFWFNPLAWHARRKAAVEHEMACDDIVCGAAGDGVDVLEYARQLLRTAVRLPRRGLSSGLPGLADRSGLERRILRIVAGRRRGCASAGVVSLPEQMLSRAATGLATVVALAVLGCTLVVRGEDAATGPAPVPRQEPARRVVVRREDDAGKLPGPDIHAAAAGGDLDRVLALLAADPDLLDRRDGDGMTPLARAAWHGRLGTVQALLDRGADPDLRNGVGLTPLFCALDRDRGELTRILVDAGADLLDRGYHGQTLLHLAARVGDLGTARRLLAAGVDVNATDTDRATALDMARWYGNHEIERLLVEAGGRGGEGAQAPDWRRRGKIPRKLDVLTRPVG